MRSSLKLINHSSKIDRLTLRKVTQIEKAPVWAHHKTVVESRSNDQDLRTLTKPMLHKFTLPAEDLETSL